jgi:hypothetical protein
MVISLAIARQNPAYRATLLHIKGVGEKTPLPFPFYALYLLSRPNAILRSCMGKEWASMGKLMGKLIQQLLNSNQIQASGLFE